MSRRIVCHLSVVAAVFVAGAGRCVAVSAEEVPLGLPAVPHPADNPSTPEKLALGRQLYFDKRLSQDNTVACATCHDPAKGYSHGTSVSEGVGGQKGGRNSPTVINAAYSKVQFWDGRAKTLEDQALGPIANPIEMNLPIAEAIQRLNSIEGYRTQFRAIFGSDATPETLAKVIACYERSILSGDAPYDRFKAGDTSALSEAAQRGMKLFFGKANCSACHSGPSFTDSGFHNIGVAGSDVGRNAVSKLAGDVGAFKTPTLREIARTAPYMHDGSMATLQEVMAHYNKGGDGNPLQDEEIFPLKLTPQEIDDVIVFMTEGLASPSYPAHTAPELPQ